MYEILIEDRAALDFQNGIDYYDEQQAGLGKKFNDSFENEISALSKNPFYQLRYSTIRCKPIKKFPYLIHFQVNEANKIVFVFAIINTSKDPGKAWLK